MRIATLVVIVLVQATFSLADGAKNYAPGIKKLQAATDAVVMLDSETGRLCYVNGHLSDQVPAGQEVEATLRFLAENKSAYQMEDPAEEVRLQRIDLDQLGMRHLRLDQQYKGLPVYGGELIAHFSKDHILTAVNGTYVDGIKIETDPGLSSDEAVQTALRDLESFFGPADPNQPELLVFPWEGETYLAWRVELFSNTPMGLWEYFVDAKSGEVIFKGNMIMDADAIGTGIGVMGDVRTHIDTDYDGFQYRMIDNTRQADNNPHGHDGQMPPGNTITTYVGETTLPGELATDDDNVWSNPSQAPAVDAHVYTALFYDWLLSTFGRNSFDNAGASMRITVDYSAEGDDNAFWNGSQVVFFSNSATRRSLAGCPDVVAHEWAHAVVRYTSNLVYFKEPGALNESFADMMGASFEFAHPEYDTPDWYMGENSYLDGSNIRDMSDPRSGGSPADYYNPWYDSVCLGGPSNDWCYVHRNSGVGSKWFYLLSDGDTHYGVTVTGIGVENAIQIAYRANAYYWTSPAGVWEAEARQAWMAVGVALPSPGLAFTYLNGRPTLLTPGEPTTFEVMVNPTYEGSLVPGSGIVYYQVANDLRTWSLMTELEPGRFQATLPAVGCGHQLEYKVEAFETTSGVLLDPPGLDWHLAEPGQNQAIIFSDDFETDKGWEADAGWARGSPTGGGGEYGGPDPSSAYSGTNVFGYNLDGDYENEIGDWHEQIDTGALYLTSPAIDCSDYSNVHIDFQRWLGVEHPIWDDAGIEVSSDKVAWTTIWENPDEIADTAWTHIDLDISPVASGQATVYVRFVMGPTDMGARYCGWNIDDFRVTAYECNQITDLDADGVTDQADNCPLAFNPLQEDSDGDSFGDVCDRCVGFDDGMDEDGDGVPDACDLCPGVFDVTTDTDGDSVPDGCDRCPGYNDLADADSDTVPDDCDNCVNAFNPGQEDADGDGIGDACCCQSPIGDIHNDGSDGATLADVIHLLDYLFFSGPARPISCPAEADFDQSGDLTIMDFSLLVNYLYISGPSEELPECAPWR